MTLQLTDCLLPAGTRADILLEGGLITAIRPASSSAEERASAEGPSGPPQLGAEGALVLPALVNGHAHLDKTLLGSPWLPHRSGASVHERVLAERALRADLPVPVAERAAALARAMVASGTGTVRTHVDIDPEVGLEGLHALLELRDQVADRLRMQIVAFPQSGILGDSRMEGLLDSALKEGADVIGGLDPVGFDGDRTAHLDVVFGLAQKHGTAVDIHLHDHGAPALEQYEDIVARSAALGMQGAVTISHAYGLGTLPADTVHRIAARFAEAGVAILTNGPAGPMPPLSILREEGVTVFAGSDNIRDAWWPYGDGDMLAIARQVAYQSGFRTDQDLAYALSLATSQAASALGYDDPGLQVGARADLLLVDAPTPAAAVAADPASRTVIHEGRPVARSRRVIEMADELTAPLP